MAKKFGAGAAFKTALEAASEEACRRTAGAFSTLQLKFVMERLLEPLFRDPPA